MVSTSHAKALIKLAFRMAGIQTRRFPVPAFVPAPVFDIAVQLLMCRKGSRLTFIQVGANDGKYSDPLRRYILEFPWTGVLVEPQPDVFQCLQDNYRFQRDRLVFENVAVSGTGASMRIYRAPPATAGAWDAASSVTSFDRAVTAKQLGVAPRVLEELYVPCLTLDTLIGRYHLDDLDILQVDVEGYEWDVLRTLDLAKTKPALIQFEHGHLTRNAVSKLTEYLTTNGYRLYFGGQENDSVAFRAGLEL